MQNTSFSLHPPRVCHIANHSQDVGSEFFLYSCRDLNLLHTFQKCSTKLVNYLRGCLKIGKEKNEFHTKLVYVSTLE